MLSSAGPPRDGVLIFNPRAARARRWRDRLRSLLPAAGVRGWLETEGPGHAAELARTAAQDGADVIVVGGGDGTVHEVANGLWEAQSRPLLFPLPLGTGNDLARGLGLPSSPARAVQALRGSRVRWLDAGQVNGAEIFVNCAGFGIDGDVMRRRRGVRLRTYTPTLLRAFLAYRPAQLEVLADGDLAYRGPVLSASVLNGPYVGGGYEVGPGADPGDGQLDLCVFEMVGLPRFLWNLWKVRRGRQGDLPPLHRRQVRRAVLRGEGLQGHLDGEYRRYGSPLTVEVIPRAFQVIG